MPWWRIIEVTALALSISVRTNGTEQLNGKLFLIGEERGLAAAAPALACGKVSQTLA